MVIEYDSSLGIVTSALFFRFSSTIIPSVITDKEFWILLLLNVTVFSMKALGFYHPDHWNLDLPFSLTGTTGGLMTFFVVFYNGHVFSRYNDLYDLTKEMFEVCINVAVILRVHIPDERLRWKVAQLLLSSCLVHLFELMADSSGDISDHTTSKAEWKQLTKLGLITEEEKTTLMEHCKTLRANAMPNFLLLQWCSELLRFHTEEPNDRFDMLDSLDQCFYHCYHCQLAVVSILELPMPFQYFHIMNLMLLLNLVLWGYSLALQDSFFAPLIFMFVQLMFQGIRELATSLSNPFGTDEVDFPLNDWTLEVYAKIHGILTTRDESEFADDCAMRSRSTVHARPRPSLIIDVNIDYENDAPDGRRRSSE
mmetsp:Transcript_79675/g.221715  ORF Transcript_79675/g.221715 Transcript_79675/m.221715 type:complete len:367 (+) Transcript_79675:165-1265(+)